MRRSVIGIICALCIAVSAYGQEPKAGPAKAGPLALTSESVALPTPTLSEMQRLALENAALKYQLAAQSAEQVKATLVQIIQSLQVPGYSLDLQTMTYVRVEPKTAAKPEK